MSRYLGIESVLFLEQMQMTEKRVEMVRQQVFSKIRWGARDEEVLDWLRDRHGIEYQEADVLLADAHRAKRKAVRTKAMITLVFAMAGILVAGGFIGLQFYLGIFYVGKEAVALVTVAAISVGVFLRNLVLLLTGKTEGSVD